MSKNFCSKSPNNFAQRLQKSPVRCFHVSFSKRSLKFRDSFSQVAKLMFIQKRKRLPSGLFISYQQVATIRLGMDEDLIFRFIPCYIIYAVHTVYLIEGQKKRLNKFIILMGSLRNSATVAWSDSKSIYEYSNANHIQCQAELLPSLPQRDAGLAFQRCL